MSPGEEPIPKNLPNGFVSVGDATKAELPFELLVAFVRNSDDAGASCRVLAWLGPTLVVVASALCREVLVLIILTSSCDLDLG